jgi:DNA-binding response OmpR family regulator
LESLVAQTRILVVDDEPEILELVAWHLEREGFHVDRALDGAEALQALRRTPPDLVVLDIMMPGLSGTEVLRVIRTERDTRRLPVILLTAKTDEIDRVVGFEMGADDYITKPFSPRELALRVRAVIRRAGGAGTGGDRLQIGSLELCLSHHQATVAGDAVHLTVKEFGLLRILMERPGQVFTREALLARVWGRGVHVAPRTIDVHMKRLRAKLGPAGDLVRTVRGVGYRLEELGTPQAERTASALEV